MSIRKIEFAVPLFLLSYFLAVEPAFSQPAEIATKEELFKITRNKDANEIIYYLNTTSTGALDLDQPIEAYWIKKDFTGEQTGRPLNSIERRYAYGLKFLSVTEHTVRFQFVSFKRDLMLKMTPQEDYVQVEIKGEMLRLKKVHLILGQGSFWIPEFTAIELHAVDAAGNTVIEIINNPRRN